MKTELAELQSLLKRIGNDPISEADTKRVIIEPILRLLGWDTTGITDIRNEFRSGSSDNPVDYALFIEGKPVLFVEAKGISQNINDRKWITQTVAYARTCGVEWAILTNGKEWAIYNALAPVDAEKKIFRKFSLHDPDAEDYLTLLKKEEIQESRLNKLWRLEFAGKQVKTELDRLLLQGNKSLMTLVAKGCKGLQPKDITEILRIITTSLPTKTIPRPTITVLVPRNNEGVKAIDALDKFFRDKEKSDPNWFSRNINHPSNKKASRRCFAQTKTELYFKGGPKKIKVGSLPNYWVYDRNLSSKRIQNTIRTLEKLP